MTEALIDSVAIVAFVAFLCYCAYGVARFGAEIDPLTWSAVAAVASFLAIVGAPVFVMDWRSAFQWPLTAWHHYHVVGIAQIAFILAVMVGAILGLRTREKARQADAARHTRMLAYVATLGPCAGCASGDLDRRLCETCRAVYCPACSLTHRPYLGYDRGKSPCPTRPEAHARERGSEGA